MQSSMKSFEFKNGIEASLLNTFQHFVSCNCWSTNSFAFRICGSKCPVADVVQTDWQKRFALIVNSSVYNTRNIGAGSYPQQFRPSPYAFVCFHDQTKRRYGSTLGFKSFDCAAIFCSAVDKTCQLLNYTVSSDTTRRLIEYAKIDVGKPFVQAICIGFLSSYGVRADPTCISHCRWFALAPT